MIYQLRRPQLIQLILPVLISLIAGLIPYILSFSPTFIDNLWYVIATAFNVIVCVGLLRNLGHLRFIEFSATMVPFVLFVTVITIPSLSIFIASQLRPTDNSAELKLWALSQGATLTMTLGVIYATWTLKLTRSETVKYQTYKIGTPSAVTYRIMRFVWIPCLIIIAAYVILLDGRIPLLYLITNPGDARTLVDLREESFKTLGVSPLFVYLFHWMRSLILPILASVTLLMWKTTRSKSWRNWFIFYCLVTLIYAGLSSAKFPVAAATTVMVLSYLFWAGFQRVKGRLPFLLVAVLFFPLFETTFKYNRGLSGFLEGLYFVVVTRILEIPSRALLLYFQAFPLPEGFLGGRSIRLVSIIIGQPFFNTANYVYLWREGDARVTTGLANAAFIGNLYADFGPIGVLVGAFLVGVLLQCVYIIFIRRKKSILAVAIHAAIIVLFLKLAISPAPPILLGDGGLLAVAFALVFLPKTAVRRKQRMVVERNEEHIRRTNRNAASLY